MKKCSLLLAMTVLIFCFGAAEATSLPGQPGEQTRTAWKQTCEAQGRSIGVDIAVSAAGEYVSIQELRETLPERWSQVYATEWRDVEIDVQPVIPDVEKLPILTTAIDFWQPDTSVLGEGAISYVADDGRFQVNQNEIREVVNAISGGERFDPPYDMDRAYGANSDATLGTIMDILQTVWVKLGQDANGLDYDRPLQLSSNSYHDEELGTNGDVSS